ncbi:FtsW/RodA/SpoVE family cell cycle protein [Planctomicrobium sp. SH664]|uniref:FtsW/RodA/SpoVE family cell cycle protein n=1 Tax=Planctomicrobium sp. SH664 TaxID=3448125 RepID=UPI003F5B70AB
MQQRGHDFARGLFVTSAGILLALGTLMVYSSSMTARPSELEQVYISRQLSFLTAGLAAGAVAALVPARIWSRIAPLLLLLTFILLIAVLMPGLGRTVNGARRWFRIGPVSLQPSEIAKLSLPLLICSWHQPLNGLRPSWQRTRGCLGLTAFTVGLIAIEPDLGTALFVGLAAALALYLTGLSYRLILLGGLSVIPPALIMLATKPYQLARIRGFIDTWVRPEAGPYQVQQSLTTLGVGGWTGTGLGKGWQKLSFLPEANTDFIFAVIGEELGLIGTLSVLLLWAAIYFSGRSMILQLPAGSFPRTAATVLLTQLVLQAGVNMAVVTALLPPKGISHPLISYGGSSLVMSLVTLGTILSLTRLPNDKSIRDNSSGDGTPQQQQVLSADGSSKVTDGLAA